MPTETMKRADSVVCQIMSSVLMMALCIVGTVRATGQEIAAKDGKADAPRTLSVPPLESWTYPDDRPDWIDAPPELTGRVHRWPVCSIPSVDADKAKADLYEQSRAAVRAYFRDQVPDLPEEVIAQFPLTDAWLDTNLIDADKKYAGTLESAEGIWHEAAAELVFTEEIREQFLKLHRQSMVGKRMGGLIFLAGIAAVSLASLSTVLRIVGHRVHRGAVSG